MRLSGSEVLLSPRRQRILALIQEYPGLCFRELVRRSDVASGTLAHHLRMLVRAGFVWEQRLGPRILHFPGSRPAELAVVGAVEEHALDSLDHALLALLRYGPLGQMAILERPDLAAVPSSTIQHRLYRLRGYGFIHERRTGRHVIYEAAPVQAWPERPRAPIAVTA